MKYCIKFAQWYEYEVEAENIDEAIEAAEENFCDDMRSPIANIVWDEVVVDEINPNDEFKCKEVLHGYS
jgi:hypothetical protein